MLDIVWFNPETARPDVTVESEWGNPAAFAFDSVKLLWVKTGMMKMLICDPQQNRDELLPRLNEKIQRFPDHATGDQYYVVNVNGNPTGGAARLYHWKATQTCVQPKAEFSESPPWAAFRTFLRRNS